MSEEIDRESEHKVLALSGMPVTGYGPISGPIKGTGYRPGFGSGRVKTRRKITQQGSLRPVLLWAMLLWALLPVVGVAATESNRHANEPMPTSGLTGTITEVTVLPKGAWVMRRVNIPDTVFKSEAKSEANSGSGTQQRNGHQAGSTRPRPLAASITVLGLPSDVDQSSVQIFAPGLFQSGPLQWQKQPVDASPAYKTIESEIAALQTKRAMALDSLDAAKIRLRIFEAQMSTSAALSHKADRRPGAFLTQSTARKSFDKLLATLISAQRKATNDLNQVDAALAEQRARLDQLKKQPEKMMLTVQLERSPATGKASANAASRVMDIRYRVRDAGWRPVYRANLITKSMSGLIPGLISGSTPGQINGPMIESITAHQAIVGQGRNTTQTDSLAGTKSKPDGSSGQIGSINAQVDWSFSASVHQNTGEDWQHIPITLSLLDNRRYYPAPRLPRWIIGFSHHPVATPLQRQRIEPSAMATASAVAVDSSGFNAEYKSTTPLTIPSGAETTVIPLQHQEIPAHATVLVAPTLSPLGILTGSFVLNNPSPLPAGQWSFFVNGAQLGSAYRPAQSPSQKMTLGFGVDQRIDVTVDRKPDQREENGVIGKSTQLVRRIAVTVHSLHKEPVPVTVILNLPIAENNEISVETLSDTTPPTTKRFDDVDGVWGWSNLIKPGQKMTLNFGFRLRWPSDKTLSGL